MSSISILRRHWLYYLVYRQVLDLIIDTINMSVGITTLVGGGTGPACGTRATTCTPSPSQMCLMLQATDDLPLNFGFTGKVYFAFEFWCDSFLEIALSCTKILKKHRLSSVSEKLLILLRVFKLINECLFRETQQNRRGYLR